MGGQSSTMFGWSWTEVSVLGIQVFGQALMESCDMQPSEQIASQISVLERQEQSICLAKQAF